MTVKSAAVLCLLVVVSQIHVAVLSAQDRVLIQQPGGSRIPISGYVEDYTGREVILRMKNGEPSRRIPRDEVVDVTTQYTPRHEQGRRLFAAGKVVEAKQEFFAALDGEDRPWVRREILAGQVKCALWKGDYHQAISRFLPIVDSDPETFHYSLIPLNWTSDEPPANIRTDARDWIGSKSPPLSRLIAASWLLTLEDNATEAEQTLKRLAREPNVRIQRLAQMQLWRLKLRKPERVDPREMTYWQQFAEELPLELRGGSYFVIGQAWSEREDHERAARAFLWLPLVYDTDRRLAGRACFEAAQSLGHLGDAPQAANLYSEVVFRYGDTPWGAKAEAAWNDIRRPTAAPSP